jgi:hypothetical protein
MLTDKQKQDIRNVIAGYAWPGGYPVYALMADSGALCPKCVKSEIRLVVSATADLGCDCGWEIVGAEVNWEDPDLYCDHCGERIESAYAEEE